MKNQETEDMYLKAIFVLQQETGYTRSIDIAKRLQRARPTVSYTMKQLKEKGYIHMWDDGRIQLTKAGSDRAAFVYESYQLLKALLMKTGADEQLAEKNASRMDRLVSASAVDVIRAYLTANP